MTINMISTMKEKYDELKRYPTVVLNCDEVLLFCPDYYKIKTQLQKEGFLDEESGFKWDNPARFKYDFVKNSFNYSMEQSIEICNLIDYIGHYPHLQKEENKNEIEKLFNGYEIELKYYSDDALMPQILSGDVVRLIEKLDKNLNFIAILRQLTQDFTYFGDERLKHDSEIGRLFIYDIFQRPLSTYQKEGIVKRKQMD